MDGRRDADLTPVMTAETSPGDGEARKVKIHYVVEGDGPPVILVHGLGASLVVWKENIIPLAETYTVYALDLPGHGLSDKPEDLGYDAVSGAHFLAWFMNTLGIQRSSLIGNSAGGLITGFCAFLYPQRVEKLVLVDSAGLGRSMAWFLRFTSLPLVGEFLHTLKVRNANTLRKSIFYESKGVSDETIAELMVSRNHPDAIRAVLKGLRSGVNLLGLRKSMQMLSQLKGISAPLLIVWGREDRIMPVSHAHRAARVLPRSMVHVFPRCGHWPQMERAEIFNPLVRQFLSGALEGQTSA